MNTKTYTPKFLLKSRHLLDVCHTLATGPNKFKSHFGRVLESVFRKDYFTLQTAVVLADMAEKDDQTKIIFAGSIMDLSRRVFEDMIYMEYISAKDKEKYSKQFVAFSAIDRKNDLDFALGFSIKIDQSMIDQIEADYATAPTKLKNGRHNWAGMSVEEIINWLVADGKIKESDKGMILALYTVGNRKNHTSPSDVLHHMNQELLDGAAEQDMDLGLMIIHGALARIGLFLIEETEADETVKKALWECWNSINKEEVDTAPSKEMPKLGLQVVSGELPASSDQS